MSIYGPIVTKACFAALLLALAAPAAGQQTRTADPGAASPAAQLTDLSWMEGTWESEGFGGKLNETYSAPAGGQMPGHFRMVADGKPGFYELVMLAQIGPTVEYRVRHFNPDMTGWEEKDKFVRFPLVAVEKDAWYFDGYTLKRTGPDTSLHIIRVKRTGGEPSEVVLSYRRVKP